MSYLGHSLEVGGSYSSAVGIFYSPSRLGCLNQSGPGNDGNEGVLRIPQSSSITGASPSDCLVSYLGHSLEGGSYSSAVGIFYSPSRLGCLNQSGPESDGNEGVLRIPQSSNITGASPSDCLVSYQDIRCGWFVAVMPT